MKLSLSIILVFISAFNTIAQVELTNYVKISDTTTSFTGTLDNSDMFGKAVEGIGDLNNDGVEDVVVDAYRDDDGYTDSGALWVLFLDTNGAVKSHQKISNTTGGLGNVLHYNEYFGISIENIGDLNGDGIVDLAVGSYFDNDQGTKKGSVYILFMDTNGTVKNHQKISDGVGGFSGGLDTYDYFGTSIANIGDIDGDGINDIIATAFGDDDGGSNKGALYVLFMDTNGTVKSQQKISNTVGSFGGSVDSDDRFSSSVESLGDINGDGIVDIAIGEFYNDDGLFHPLDKGAIWVLFLNSDGTVQDEQKISSTAGDFGGFLGNSDSFGYALQNMGDIDSDGDINLMVSAILDDDGGTDQGAIWILNIGSDGKVNSYQKISDTTAIFTGNLNPSDRFGTSIAYVGDLNNDGVQEYAISAQNDDDGGTDRGAVYIMSFKNILPEITDPIVHKDSVDLLHNWSYAESYDENGTVIGKSKQYVDELGRNTQSITFNIAKNKAITTQTVFDSYGRPVVNSMPAPIGSHMVYRSAFFTDGTDDPYDYTNYDSAARLNNPDSVGKSINNSLGKYYSDNSDDDYMATTAFPYSRIEYMADPTGRVKRTSAPGEDFKMGSGHESRMFYMFTGGELDSLYGVDSSYYVTTNSSDRLQSSAIENTQIVAEKNISIDAEGNIAISFKSDGLMIASCVSGKDTLATQEVSQTMLFEGTRSVDIHLPETKSTTLKLKLPTYYNGFVLTSVLNNEIDYSIMDLETNTVLDSGADYTISVTGRLTNKTVNIAFTGASQHRFLRITYDYTATKLAYFEDNDKTPPDLVAVFETDYSRFTTNYYDLAGRLRKNVSPKGYGVAGSHTEFSKYDYDPYGQLIAKETPDEGLMEYLYSDEGAVRFSQNAQQAVDGNFSYVRYDEYNRSVESGEYDETSGVFEFAGYYDTAISGTDVKDTVDVVGFEFNDAYCSNQSYIAYDILASTDEIPSAYTYKNSYPQHNLKARVAKTWNENNQTWYSYDYAGRPEYTIQEILDNDFSTTKDETIKTVDYTYAPLTSVLLKEEFQKNHSAEKLTHHYTYNDNLQLEEVVATNNISDTIGQAAFEYSINGQLKRKELGGTLQGIDYTYTLHGQLKSINHPSLYDEYDPGQDGKTGSTNANFEADLFGMALDYYQNDYVRTGSNIKSSVTTGADGYYNGLIKATRWRVKDQNEITRTSSNVTLYSEAATDQELMYNYTYDDFNRFETATFGVFDNDAVSSTFTERNDFKVFGGSTDYGIAYDIIGNINNLYRNGYEEVSGPGLMMDSLSYSYNSGTSQLANITDYSSSTYATDFKTTGAASFTYNSLGQMIASVADSVDTVGYYPNGQVKRVVFSNGNTAEYYYNERNIKIKSKFTDVTASTTKYNWYITDASGALKSVYDSLYHTSSPEPLALNQQAVYGGGRLGMYDVSTGFLNYELSDHLGNVRVTVRDTSSTSIIKPEVTSWADYYPFGEVLPGRNSNPTGMFGYQGQERVSNGTNDVSGSRWYNFNLRMYNPALGRFNTIDPYSQFNSPYLAMANNPISFVDPDGGRAIFSEYHKANLMKKFQGRVIAGEYMGRPLEFLRHWESISGNQYMGLSANEAYAYGVKCGYDAMISTYQLDHIMGGYTAPGGMNSVNPHPKVSDRSNESIGAIVDGMHLNPSTAKLFFEGIAYKNGEINDYMDIDWSNSSTGSSIQDGIINENMNIAEKNKANAIKDYQAAGYSVSDLGSEISYGGLITLVKSGEVVGMTSEFGVISFKGMRPNLPKGWWKLAKGSVVNEQQNDLPVQKNGDMFSTIITGLGVNVFVQQELMKTDAAKWLRNGKSISPSSIKLLSRIGAGVNVISGGIEINRFSNSDKSWGDWGKLGIVGLSIGLTYGGAPYIGVPLGIWDASGELDWFYGGMDFKHSEWDGNTWNDNYYINSPYKISISKP